MKKRILLAAASAATAAIVGCATSPVFSPERHGLLALEDFHVRTGGHCESSAMLNALDRLGYGLTEADIVGGGGAPSFLFTKDDFPFIGGRNERLREHFLDAAKIPYRVALPAKGAGDWEAIATLLGRGLPVLLRVDMRFLPYLYGGKYGSAYMSFGGHWVCLYGLDFDRREALVTDTGHEVGQRIALVDLERARSSATKVFPPRGEYAWIEARPALWRFDPDALTRKALATVLENYRGTEVWPGMRKKPLVGLSGLAEFPASLASIHSLVNPYSLAPAWSYMAGSIERNGTGGAAFRRLFRDFLAARAVDCLDARLRSACAALLPATDRAISAWRSLAAAFDEAAALLGAASGKDRPKAIASGEEKTGTLAEAVYKAESELRDEIAAIEDI